MVSGLLLGETIYLFTHTFLMGVVIAALISMLAIMYLFYCLHCKRINAILAGILFFSLIIMEYFYINDFDNKINYLSDTCKNGERFFVTGRIYDIREKENSIYCYIDKVSIKKIDRQSKSNRNLTKDDETVITCNKILLIMDKDNIKNSNIVGYDIIAFAEYISYREKRNDGGYDEKKYYQSLEIEGKFYEESHRFNKNKHFFSILLHRIYGQKRELLNRIERLSKSENEKIYSGLLLGVREDIDEESMNLYRLSGIAHILSISGLHISIIGYFIYKILRKKCCLPVSGVISILVMYAYILMTGNMYSARRAFIMFLINIMADIMGKSYDLMSALSVALICLLFDNPFSIYNAGVQLSFGAITGIGVVYSTVDKFLKLKSKIVNIMVSGMSVHLVTLPVIINSYHMFMIYSPLINVYVVSVMGVMVTLGFVGLFLSYISYSVGKFVFNAGGKIICSYKILCRLFLKLPEGIKIARDISGAKLCIYYFVLCIMFICIKYVNKKNNDKQVGLICKKSVSKQQKNNHMKLIYNAIYLIMRIGLFFGIYSISLLFLTYHREDKLIIKMIDVGQGESIFIDSYGMTMLVDAGSSSQNEIEKYTVLPFLKSNGVKSLDYLLITHSDYDHISGANQLMNETINGRSYVKNLVLQDIDDSAKDEAYMKLIASASKNNINIIYFSKGKLISDGKTQIKCLWPESKMKGNDKNSLSIAFELTCKEFKMLFTGDLPSDMENRLPAMEIGKVSVLKAGHHGSNGSSGLKFIKKIQPDASIISCGQNNRYGHPGEETLKRLSEIKSDVYITANSGQITIIYKENRFYIETFLR